MASARKRGNGYEIKGYCGLRPDTLGRIDKYEMWYPEPGMTPKQIEKALEKEKHRFEEEIKHGNTYNNKMKFCELVELWKNDYAKNRLAPKTYSRYGDYLKRILPVIGHIKLKDLSPVHLNRLYESLTKYGLKRDRNGNIVGDGRFAPKTILEHHRVVSAILSMGVRWGIVEQNVASRATPPKVPYKERAYLNEEQTRELVCLLEKVPIIYKTMTLLLIHTGMRRGELMGLEWKDIDFEANTMRIVRTSQIANGIITKEPKTKSSIRTLTFGNTVHRLLTEFRLWQNKRRLKAGADWIQTDRLFTTKNGEPLSPDSISCWFKRFIRISGLPIVTLHSLRHSNATLMIAEDVDIATVSKRLGHSNTATTLNIYTHALKSRDKVAAEKLDDILAL